MGFRGVKDFLRAYTKFLTHMYIHTHTHIYVYTALCYKGTVFKVYYTKNITNQTPLQKSQYSFYKYLLCTYYYIEITVNNEGNIRIEINS